MLLHQRLEEFELLLASQSPRRQELLRGCGVPFRPAPKYDVEETYPPVLQPHEVPAYLSRLKSEAYPDPLTGRQIVITADTVVIVRGSILGKPASRDDAVRMLRLLSGGAHTVVTGVTLRSLSHTATFSVSSDVVFRPLSDEEIEYYVDNFRPYDKAGSYGIQEWIGYVAIERIEGSFYNVMGLPVQRLYVELGRFLDAM